MLCVVLKETLPYGYSLKSCQQHIIMNSFQIVSAWLVKMVDGDILLKACKVQ